MRAKLTKKQRLFLAEFQKDWNGTWAAIRAGYSPKTAKEIAYQLLHKTSLKEVLAQEMEERLLEIGVRTERVLEEVARIGFSDIRKLFNADGSLKLPKDWDPETAAAIAGFGIVDAFSGKGDDRKVIGLTKKVRLFDKMKALEILAKHLKLFPTGDQKVGVEVHVNEAEPPPLSNLELSARIVYLVKVAAERKKQWEEKNISGQPKYPGKI